MARPLQMTDADRARVDAAVAAAERATTGEIVPILASGSDDYGDIALAWAALAGLLALFALAIAPAFYLSLYERITGAWVQEWQAGGLFGVAALVAALKFAGTWLILLWRPLRLRLVPAQIRNSRVRTRAILCFRVGTERRTAARTGVVIYLSLAEHRAEIVADAAIAAKVSPELWGDAMAAMLTELKAGRMADGLIAAVTRVGAVLAEHFPRTADDINELPDRLVEV